jgi:lipopolysaccharide export LptBFGC system permease protein LptF
MDKMMVSELLKTIFSVLAVLVVIIVSRNFIKILKMAVDGLISNEAIFSILGLKIILVSASFLVLSITTLLKQKLTHYKIRNLYHAKHIEQNLWFKKII